MTISPNAQALLRTIDSLNRSGMCATFDSSRDLQTVEALEKRGLVRWGCGANLRQQGWQLTTEGRDLLSRL